MGAISAGKALARRVFHLSLASSFTVCYRVASVISVLCVSSHLSKGRATWCDVRKKSKATINKLFKIIWMRFLFFIVEKKCDKPLVFMIAL
jgi:hypothetical protein